MLRNNWKKILSIILPSTLFFGLVLVLFQDDFRIAQTSLVKYLYGGSHQCVAYIEKYYQNMFDIKIKNVGKAMLLAKKASRYDLYFHKNGSNIIPQPGDILIFGNKNTVGHVAIITGTLPNGVLIVEQNWIPSKITNNNGKILPAEYRDGRYTIFDRYYNEKTRKNKFWIMGWVSRMNRNPVKFFNFSNESEVGWLPEHDVVYRRSDNQGAWTVKVVGKDPRILSPVFLDGLEVENNKVITFKAKVENNPDATEGVLYLRDGNHRWSRQIPFAVDYSNNKFQTFSIDLSGLGDSFKITQIKLKLANNNKKYREIWKIDWLRIGGEKNILGI